MLGRFLDSPVVEAVFAAVLAALAIAEAIEGRWDVAIPTFGWAMAKTRIVGYLSHG